LIDEYKNRWLSAGITIEEIREFIGVSEEIEDILLSDAGNAYNVLAVIKVNTSEAGVSAMAEFIDGQFFNLDSAVEHRFSAVPQASGQDATCS